MDEERSSGGRLLQRTTSHETNDMTDVTVVSVLFMSVVLVMGKTVGHLKREFHALRFDAVAKFIACVPALVARLPRRKELEHFNKTRFVVANRANKRDI